MPARSWIEVSLRRIAENFRTVRAVVGDTVTVMPVIKADAYRHGAVAVGRTLAAEGAQWLAVSSVEEGSRLREAGIAIPILAMADFLPAERDELLARDLTPVIHSLGDLGALDRLAAERGAPIRYHLKIDTGMGRLGERAAAREIAAAVLAARHARMEGLMTHFASAADYTAAQTDEQLGAFEVALAALRAAGVEPRYVHMAGTIAIAYGRRPSWGSMVRPGHAIYGYVSPARGEAPANLLAAVRPALTWKARLLAVKDVPAGSPIGYGGMFRSPRPMRIGILAAGYADGLPHRLSNRGKVIAGGKLAPILGAVSMDLTTIDLSQSAQLHPGDAVTLLGSEGGAAIDAQQMARAAGTISYSVLCGIGARVERIYTDG